MYNFLVSICVQEILTAACAKEILEDLFLLLKTEGDFLPSNIWPWCWCLSKNDKLLDISSLVSSALEQCVDIRSVQGCTPGSAVWSSGSRSWLTILRKCGTLAAIMQLWQANLQLTMPRHQIFFFLKKKLNGKKLGNFIPQEKDMQSQSSEEMKWQQFVSDGTKES